MQDKKWSALFYAYEGGHHGTVKLLIEYGADETLKDKVSEFVVVVVVVNVICLFMYRKGKKLLHTSRIMKKLKTKLHLL